MSFSTLFFDLDSTLYPSTNGLWDQIRNRIFQFMGEVVGIPEEEISDTRDRYWKTYGTTLEGLRIHHQVDPEKYLAYVHDIPLDEYLQEDRELKGILESLPQELWVFTNSDRSHAQAVLDVMGIGDQFSGIIDLLAMSYAVKPQPRAFQIALRTARVDNPARSILFDDLMSNLQGAKSQGMKTALVNLNGQEKGADYYLDQVHDIKDVMPQLWAGA